MMTIQLQSNLQGFANPYRINISHSRTKYSRTTIRGYLVDIVTKYDVILIQEIKEKAQTMILKFLADCQAVRSTYDMALSIRWVHSND